MTTDQEQPEQPENAPDVAKNTEPGPIPYSRFKEVNDGYKALKERLEAIEAKEAEAQKAAKEAAEKRLAEQQQFAELAEQRKSELEQTAATAAEYKAKVEAQMAVLNALYDAEKTAVPEMYHELLDSLDVIKRLEWIANNKEKLTAVPNGGIPKTPVPKGKGEISDEQRRRQAARAW